jgi:ribonuclease III
MFSEFVQKLKKKKKIKMLTKLFTEQKIMDMEAVIRSKINDRTLYVQALVHRSYLEGNDEQGISNERLEFLGDAVLNLVVAEFLYTSYPEKDEGFLTKVRAKVVNRTALANAANIIGLNKYILIGKNLSQSFKSGAKTVLSDAFEALIGAIYLDSNIDNVKRFINRVLIQPIIKEDDFLVDENFKSQLLEYVQAKKMGGPSYIVVDEEGPQHNRVFVVKALINGKEYGIGQGRNKKTAEQNAAQAAIEKLKQDE